MKKESDPPNIFIYFTLARSDEKFESCDQIELLPGDFEMKLLYSSIFPFLRGDLLNIDRIAIIANRNWP